MSPVHAAAPLDLTVVVISYNSGQLILDNLSEVIRSPRWRSLIVDNNSTDNTPQLLREAFLPESVLALPANAGYGRAANAAFERLQTRYALLLNPDIVVSEAAVEAFMQDAMKLSGEAAIVAPATAEKDYLHQGPVQRRDVLGAAMLFDMQQMQSVGVFDNNLFLFYEEKDLCRRVNQSGLQVLLTTDHYFTHAKGTSSGGSIRIYYLKQWHVGWSSCYYLCKHRLNKGRKRPVALLLRYLLKSLFSGTALKRLKYRARVAGVSAYLTGKRSFDDQGKPRGWLS